MGAKSRSKGKKIFIKEFLILKINSSKIFFESKLSILTQKIFELIFDTIIMILYYF